MFFEINQSENRISHLQIRTFSELKIKEREDLQEWLANTSDALGEELLIIQKEFDGFAETKERLDMLALDKNGTLVIIENKLDDTGRDVVWQALKYVAYCSSLKKSEIISMFQDYLRKQGRSDDASDLIRDFLEVDSIDEVSLNSGSDQRFILVAANFRKEVTSTVLWLISNGIKAKCMKVVPYAFDADNEILLLDITQIIPTPEAEDYMISMSSKDSEEKETKKVTRRSEQLRLKFWERTLDHMRKEDFELFSNVSPSRDNRLNAGSGKGGCVYTMVFSKEEARVEFNLARSSRDENKQIYDYLLKQKDDIEKRFGQALDWKRGDEQQESKISHSKHFDGFNEESWPSMISWLFEHIQKLEMAFKQKIQKTRRQ